jgi:hypothetical protein
MEKYHFGASDPPIDPVYWSVAVALSDGANNA